jgi:hypothetical protein
MIRTLILSAGAAALLTAQTEIRRATIKGQSGDRGKCTIEVVVDVAAEVAIHGDTGELRTLGGQPSQWRRMECTGPLTYNPADFKFTGVDGRGSQNLVADPRQNNGVAVIRIDDPKAGSEGYTFDIEWRGGVVGNSGPSYPTGGSNVPAMVASSCQNAVRDRAIRDFGSRELVFGPITTDTTPGRANWVTGTFDTRGFRRDSFQFGCWMDFRTGEVRSVEVRRAGEGGSRGGETFGREQSVRICQDAAANRVQQDGYGEARIRWADLDSRPGRPARVEGTLSARGRDGLEYFIDFSCALDFERGQVRSVDVRQR